MQLHVFTWYYMNDSLSIRESGHFLPDIHPGLPPPGWIALYELKQVSEIQLLFRDRTISINPASTWTKNMFHQI